MSGFWEALARFVVRRSRATLVGVGVVTLFFGSFLPRIETDTSILAFVRPAARELVETIEDEFGEGSYLTLVFESRAERSLLEPELLHQQLRILQEIDRRFDVTTYSLVEGIDQGLRRVKNKSLFEHEDYADIAEAIIALAGGRTVEDLEKVSSHYVSHPEAITFYAKLRLAGSVAPVRPPGVPDTEYRVRYLKAIKALVRLAPDSPREERKLILAEIRDLAASLSTPELAVHAVSDDLITHDIDMHARRNALLLGAMVLGVDALCLIALFRSRRELWIVLTILTTASIWTFGAVGMLGVRLSFLHLLGLPILLGTGIDDTLVFGRRLAEERARGLAFHDALRATFAGVGNAIFLTTFTTFLAFLLAALTAAAPVVFSFYLLVSFSMVALLILATLLQGALRAELFARAHGADDLGARAPASTLDAATRRVAGLSSRLIERGAGATLLVTGMIAVLALVSAARLESEFTRDDMLRRGMPTERAHRLNEEYFGDTRVGYLVLTGDVENPELLRRLARLPAELDGHPRIQQVLGNANVESVVDLAEKLRIRLTPETDVRALLDRITSDERTANFVLDMSFADAADRIVRKTGERYDGLLMRFFFRPHDASTIRESCDAVSDASAAVGIDRLPGVDATIGGGEVVTSLESPHYRDAMLYSFFTSVLVNFLVLWVAWRRLRPALLAMVPLLLGAALMVGVMPVFGVTLNPINLSIGAIVVGLGIDYPIHIVERFDEERRLKGLDPASAARAALSEMGPHILAGMLTTSVGFCASTVLLLPLAESFGLLTGFAVVLIYLGSVFVLPVLLVWIYDRAPLREESS